MDQSVNPFRLYIHIPFCVRKCNYCDFVSFAGKEDCFAPYVDALCNEIRAYGALYGERKISSVFFGGGTPSILPTELFSKIMETVQDSFLLKDFKEKRRGIRRQKVIRPATEISMECNPGTVDKQKLKAYKKMGINRISFGLQSTDPSDLRTLGRIHTYNDFEDSFEAAREAGFDNINVDLMQAVPGQTLESWKRVLAITSMWKPEHLSAYSLIIEEGTPFYELNEKGLLNLPDEDTEREIYYYTKEFLEKSGYQRYEISNYAVPGFECQHNIGYWRRDDYLGLGLNSSSMINNVRWKNTEDLNAYLDAFSGAEKAADTVRNARELFANGEVESEDTAIREMQKLSRKEQMEEFMFLGLRLICGISKQDFFDTFGQDFDFTYGPVVYELKTKGLIEDADGRVFLTDRGIDISNTVMAEFLLE